MSTPLQTALPYDPFTPRPLPGVLPLDMGEWLIVDEAVTGQMALREALLAEQRNAVLRMDESAREAAEELLALVLELAYPGAVREAVRPDGMRVTVDWSDPLGTLGRLVQEDFCLLMKRGDEHVLSGAVLCFPASWSLSEKFQQPLIGIHEPVASYDADIARRVQRLFDGVRPGRPLWRFNALWYADAVLHQPRSVHERRPRADPATAPFFRSERQSIVRLPKSGAVVFSIHTYVLTRDDALRGA